jgi:hypothetical protein
MQQRSIVPRVFVGGVGDVDTGLELGAGVELEGGEKWTPVHTPLYLSGQLTGSSQSAENLKGGDAVPSGSPDGWPWLVWIAGPPWDGYAPKAWGGYGLASNGVWWRPEEHPDNYKTSWWVPHTIAPGAFVAAPSFGEKMRGFVEGTVIPMAIVVASTLIGGPAGMLTAAGLNAVVKIAKGQSITASVIELTKTSPAIMTLLGGTKFDETIAAARAGGLDAIAAVGRDLKLDAEIEAFNTARGIATAIVAQRDSVKEMSAYITASQVATTQKALAAGASVLDIANAFGGHEAAVWMDSTLTNNATPKSEIILNRTTTKEEPSSSVVAPLVVSGGGAVTGFMLAGPAGALIGGGLGWLLGSKF